MLILNNVSAGYEGVDVIRGVSFEVKGNISIVGPNGCGKSTLLKAMAKIIPVRGDIELFGKSYGELKRREISLNVAMLSQQPNVYFAYSVFDTVMMGRYLHIKARAMGSPTEEDRRVVRESLEAVNLLAERDRDITKLSGGQLQRVFLARALAQEPRIILLDEPTNHLDIKCQIEIIEYLKKWAVNGRAVVGVLHDLNLAMMLSGHMIVMKDGEIQVNGAVREIIAGGQLDVAYGMDVAGYMRRVLGEWGL